MAGDLIIIKFGGSLITNKSKLCSPRTEIIEKTCAMVSEIIKLGKKVIIVHGAGSFGHIKAKKWKIFEGMDSNIKNQLEGVHEVREDMKILNNLIVSMLNNYSIDAKSYPPHQYGGGEGMDYKFSKDIDEFINSNIIPVVYGDVVETYTEKGFGILSGDDICEILTNRYKPKHVIFAIDGAEGIIDNPNDVEGGNLIEKYVVGTEVVMNKVENDVTGGMELKIMRATNCFKMGSRVSIINGNNPQMIMNAILGKGYTGTEFVKNKD